MSFADVADIKKDKNFYKNWRYHFGVFGWVVTLPGCPGPSGAGVIVRNDYGGFVCGLSVPFKRANSSYLCSAVLNELEDIPMEVVVLLDDIKHLMNAIPEVKMTWNYREGNWPADAFARYASNQANDEVWMGDPFNCEGDTTYFKIHRARVGDRIVADIQRYGHMLEVAHVTSKENWLWKLIKECKLLTGGF
ncbi:hypothetical protein IFM89_003155 [Coptis chinensis]|uniref:RNase H type-1 domain-containing protein n=1 Tax=Coptis chinensis TaxID=261450 RepID=A0A835I4Z6_9MAGN|nr:hypothetical protein IFM89_003155 [Coptis chinensis]